MAKENEKKVSGDMSSEELENVSGGACWSSGIPATHGSKSLIKDIEEVKYDDGSYKLVTTYTNGSQTHILVDAFGRLQISDVAKPSGT